MSETAKEIIEETDPNLIALRDKFAMHALAAMDTVVIFPAGAAELAARAYDIADAMLEERLKAYRYSSY